MPTQPSILRMLQSRMKSAVKQYIAAKDKLDKLYEILGPEGLYPDDLGPDDLDNARDRERLLRGVVRGSAQMYIAVCNPAQANSKDAINDIEVDYGMPGKRSRPKAPASNRVSQFLDDYYGTDDES